MERSSEIVLMSCFEFSLAVFLAVPPTAASRSMTSVTDSLSLLFQETPNSVFLVMEVSLEMGLRPSLFTLHSWKQFVFGVVGVI